MIEAVGDLWLYPAHVRMITTNASIRADGKAVMGAGCALEAKLKYPGIDSILAEELKFRGNHVSWLRGGNAGDIIFSFPTKGDWQKPASLALIQQSAKEAAAIFPRWATVVLPRPGCGNGGLKWEAVKPIIAPYLDKRFVVISRGEDK